MKPTIRKAKRVSGKSLIFRDASTTDAEFITRLRTDARISRYLSETQPEIVAQERWLEKYLCTHGQAYFIIEDRSGDAIGTVRLYDANQDSFCWGSWILKEGSAMYAAIESALMVYDFGINHLGFCSSHFDVRKENKRVWRFHESFGAVRVSETSLDYFYTISQDAISESLEKYHRFLPEKVDIEWH